MITLDLADETATARLGEDIAAAMAAGDLIALAGDLGTGKTTLARAIIRALCGDPELDVPSPTYTLVQTYDGRFPVAHFDFYRLNDPEEVRDLGLDDALDGGAAIAEWPENAAGCFPEPAVAITLTEGSDGGRIAMISASAAAETRVMRSIELRRFLTGAGWGEARRTPLAGDASTRSYETVELEGFEPRLVMNWPERLNDPPVRNGLPYSRIAKLSTTVVPFVAVDHALRQRGFSAPEIFAADLEAGYLLLENLGAEGIVDESRDPMPERYEAAAGLLADMHNIRWPAHIDAPFGAQHDVPVFDRDAMLIEVSLLLDWYMPAVTGRTATPEERAAFDRAWNAVIDLLDDVEKNLVLRDYHSPNIIWRADRDGNDRLGLIDFQDAFIGPPAYDLASLAQDARVTVSRELEVQLFAHYCERRSAGGAFDRDNFAKAYAIMACQRSSKILGIFVRLDQRDGKPVYLQHLPRMRDYLARSIGHVALSPVRDLYSQWNLIEGQAA